MRINVNGVRLYFDIEGPELAVEGAGFHERPTLILLHGAPGFSDHTGFRTSLADLRDVAQIVYLDLRGAGRSEAGPRELWTLEQWADDVVGLCDALEIEKPIVLGQSGGGMVAMAYAIRHPDHARALILSSTQAHFDLSRVLATFERRGGIDARTAAQEFLTGDMQDGLADFARICMPLYSAQPDRTPPPNRSIVRPELARSFHTAPDGTWFSFDFREAIAGIRCPTLILGGEEDPICPIEDQEDIARTIAPELVRFERFANCGHGVYQDNPTDGLRVISEFITANSPKG